ncbi:MAG TPA: L,D-transpeptidase [Candidatus Dormibacteraeota bacterium]|jgi:lipoprotein-anchoring transpeptidase ErfK/SrfK|nr:L,D-transpeptidase [Candidatus Dormibacteraeota bacterium]
MLRRVLVGVVVALVAIAAIGGGGDAYAYGQRLNSLKTEWREAEAAGVPAARFAPLQRQLDALPGGGGPVPYGIVSGALFRNPLEPQELNTTAIYDEVLDHTRQEAKSALSELEQAYGPTPFDRSSLEHQLDQARQPLDYERLAQGWNHQTKQLDATRDQLSTSAKGLQNGLPADVVADQAQIQQSIAKLQQEKLWVTPGPATLTTLQSYLKGSYAQMLAQHGQISTQASSATGALTQRLNLYGQGTQLEGDLPSLLPYAGTSNDPSLASQAKQQFSAATNDPQLTSSVQALQSVVNDLSSLRQADLERLTAGTAGCSANGSGKTILVSLSQQRLVACDGTSTYLSTLVTTGQPALPTPAGSYQVLAKFPSYYMVSLCKPGTYCWYPSTTVYDAMEFMPNYFIHSWYEPAYGPGTEDDLTVASHGCIHVPMDQLQLLYAWAQVGTAVIVTS